VDQPLVGLTPRIAPTRQQLDVPRSSRLDENVGTMHADLWHRGPVDRADLVSTYLAALDLAADSPTPGLLDELVRRHVATFAFSSVGPRLGDDLPLEPEALLDRILVRRRGGYCFEHNGLLFEVLDEIGYRPRLVLARVLLSGNPHPALTHRVNLVELDGAQLVVDVGFGAPGPHLAVPLGGAVVGSSWRRFRVVETRPGAWCMQTLAGDDWLALYRFELHEYGTSDVELGHFWSHRSPQASFPHVLVASRILDDEVRSLRDRDYRVLRPAGEEQRTVADDDLRRLLHDELDVHVTPAESTRLLPPP
jgi:N-hydroxyarylamine O-acetyltransferase